MNPLKRFSSLLVIGTVLFSMVLPAMVLASFVMPFNDLPLTHPDYIAVMYLKNKGVISGYPDGTFRPNQAVSRVEALKMIYSSTFKSWEKVDGPCESGAVLDDDEIPLKDVDKTAWYWNYLRTAYSDQVVSGYADGTFRPTQAVNLAENLKMLLNRYSCGSDHINTLEVAKAPYNDVAANAWYAKFVEYAKETNLIDADNNNNVHPGQFMTRAKLAQTIYRLMKMDEDGLDLFIAEPLFFQTGDLKVTVEKTRPALSATFTADQLDGAAQECGSTHPANYFQKMLASFGQVKMYSYVITAKESPDENFTIMAMPNVFDYQDLNAFKKDFDVCAAGGLYPTKITKEVLVWEGSCGAAYDKMPALTCSDIQQKVEPTMVIDAAYPTAAGENF